MADSEITKYIDAHNRVESIFGSEPEAELPPSALEAIDEAIGGLSFGVNDDVQRVIIAHGLTSDDIKTIEASLGNASLGDPRLQKAREEIDAVVYESLGMLPSPAPTPEASPSTGTVEKSR